MAEASNVIPFPVRLRTVPSSLPPSELPSGADGGAYLVEHDGGAYVLDELLRVMPTERLRELEAAAPRSGQETWDLVVRQWPALAAEIVAGASEAR